MREVVVLGTGITKFGRSLPQTIDELAGEAAHMAIRAAGVNPKDVEIGYVGNVYEFAPPGPRAFTQVEATGIPVTKVETACASCSRAVGIAYQEIAGGFHDVALVIGVEKMPHGPIAGLAAGGYGDIMGTSPPPGIYATIARRHMELYGTKLEHFARQSVKSHKNACLAPWAMFQKEVTLEEVLNSRIVADPITLYMCSNSNDGATAVLICSKEKAKQYATKFVTIASYSAGGPLWVENEPLHIEGHTPTVAKKAYEQAGIGPEDVDVVQVHDAFSPAEIFQIEDLGFVPVGEGGSFVWEGNADIDGRLPVNTDGGLVSCGHPVGATGGRMIHELGLQLKGEAGLRQVDSPKVALMHNGGVGGINVMIFKI